MNFKNCFVVLLWCACCWHIADIFALTKFSNGTLLRNKQKQQYIELHYTNSCIDCVCYMYDILIDIFQYNDVASCWYCCSMMNFEMHQISMCDEESEIRVFRSPIFFKTTVKEIRKKKHILCHKSNFWNNSTTKRDIDSIDASFESSIFCASVNA